MSKEEFITTYGIAAYDRLSKINEYLKKNTGFNISEIDKKLLLELFHTFPSKNKEK